jgi:RNA polymerase sigma factor (sigma-70 family)
VSTLTLPEPTTPDAHDARLVTATLAGDREAFAAIVSRYRALVCSVAYSATGSLTQSEDVAQEAFVAAWRSLGQLEEPEKLRPWLCGITRNLASNARRRDARDPARAAEPLAATHEDAVAGEPLPVEQAISREQEAILWRKLERVNETYRTPLILFYREQQSVERVAALLGLGEDVVRQRLARGRRALADEVLAFVEGTLSRSAPGDDFTLGVLAGLPASGGAAVGGASLALAKTGVLAKSAAIAAALVGILGIGTGAYSAWSTLRTGLALARTPAERALVVRQVKTFVLLGVIFTAMSLCFLVPRGFWATRGPALGATASALSAVYAATFVALVARALREQRRVAAGRPAREWRSKTTLLGLPLWHVRLDVSATSTKPVVAWVAVGDYAVGVLFALGTVSVGGVSVGAVSVGLIDVGTVALGAVSIGAVPVGLLAVGTVSAGLVAFGGVAFGWRAAGGAAAFGHELAGGELALAPHANDAVAAEFFTRIHSGALCQALLVLTAVLVVVPLTWLRRRARKLRSTE